MSVVRRAAWWARHAFWFEVAIWVALGRWIARRPDVPRGATPLHYGRLVGPLLWLFVWGSALEVVAVDLAMHALGWSAARIPLLAVGVWSVIWMLGLLASLRTRPHLVTDEALRLRAGLLSEIVVPLSAVTGTSTREHALSGSIRSVEVLDERLLVGVNGRTNVVLVLAGPTTLTTARGEVVVREVAVWVDEPREAVAAVRRRMQVA